jgi:hypothetical protein
MAAYWVQVKNALGQRCSVEFLRLLNRSEFQRVKCTCDV